MAWAVLSYVTSHFRVCTCQHSLSPALKLDDGCNLAQKSTGTGAEVGQFHFLRASVWPFSSETWSEFGKLCKLICCSGILQCSVWVSLGAWVGGSVTQWLVVCHCCKACKAFRSNDSMKVSNLLWHGNWADTGGGIALDCVRHCLRNPLVVWASGLAVGQQGPKRCALSANELLK